jgi:hypothetical protein
MTARLSCLRSSGSEAKTARLIDASCQRKGCNGAAGWKRTPGASGAGGPFVLGCCMAKKPEPVDDLLDALIWMRRKAKKREPVDEIIDALLRMRRAAKSKLAKRKVKKRAYSKSKRTPRKSVRR